jgi:N-acetyl-gamma-glutamyl-phosphate/LysW-gamma-L-alpha-aminoadipyl-6-phosphate reductase
MKVGVLGASGFVGGELLRLLLRHPSVEVTTISSREYAGEFVHRAHPHLRGVSNLQFTPFDLEKVIGSSDLVFVCLPLRASLDAVPRLMSAGVKVIDMSPAYRLPRAEDFQPHYNFVHPDHQLLTRAVYGLPELYRSSIASASLVANPGCMALASILALAPFAEVLDDKAGLIVDAKVGSSGSGSKPSVVGMHAMRYGTVRPYKLGNHRHGSEVRAFLRSCGKEQVSILFSAHAVNMVRGILITLYVTAGVPIATKDVWRRLRGLYGQEHFIRLIRDKQGSFKLPDPKLSVGSNFCDIGFELDADGRHLMVVAALDNLMKGASGNAVQCLNVMQGYPENTALDLVPVFPV